MSAYLAMREADGGFEPVRPVLVADVRPTESGEPEVIIAEFTYHGRAGAGGDKFLRPAIFVLKIRDGQIVQSRDYLSEPRHPNGSDRPTDTAVRLRPCAAVLLNVLGAATQVPGSYVDVP